MATRKVRVKKLSTKTPLPVLREDQIDPNEYESLTAETQIATGVEQAEENEYHLQAIIKTAGTSQDAEIPVPPPVEAEGVDFDAQYPNAFETPHSYIRFSSTVEECISCQYDMTMEDEDFLKQYNSKKSANQLSEDDFERMMEVFEDIAADQTPFASVDNTVVAYDQMVPRLNHVAASSAKVMSHAKFVYEYWKSRRLELGNKSLHPTLKFETHQESDDTDPYVCFRRREARQTRKTRARDVQSAEKLKRLRKEIEDGRQVVVMTAEREQVKRDLMLLDRLIFTQRAKLKEMKIRLKIKDNDDDLINQKPQKRRPADVPLVQRVPGSHLRLAMRPDGKAMDSDMPTLADKLAEKENELRHDVEIKIQNHRKWNHGHIDLTRDPLSPVKEQGMELSFRPAKTQYLMTPPASTDSMDLDEEPPAEAVTESRKVIPFQFKAGGGKEQHSVRQPAFRRRIGRLNRLWIDRRGLASPPGSDSEEQSDRWKYDHDDDDEPPVYEVDPFDTRALRFRATIPLSPYMFPRRQMAPPDALVNGHNQVAGGRPALPQPAPPQQGQGS